MWTIEYKGSYIHGYCDKDDCKVQIYIGGGVYEEFRCKSLHAAKLLITKMQKQEK